MISSIIISVLVFVHIFFLIAVIRKNFAVIDIGWGLGITLIALVSYLHNPLSIKNAILLMLVVVWGLRLALYIFARARGKGEDPRYNRLRQSWGSHANSQAYLKVFLGQGILMMIVSLPLSSGMALNPSNELSLLNWIGVGVWTIGLTFEIWADSYMAWWKSRPEHKGTICTTGPWKLCRFPNYFGEALLWYGIYLASFSLPSSWSILGPITINFLLLKVTGVPPLERSFFKRPGYEEYAKRVPRFVPFTKP
jgi:steroid 5-alpha reductase family enzyme